MDYPERKSIRLKNFDYSSNGCYFITVCTKDKKPIFWASEEQSPPRLSHRGKIVKYWFLQINEKYPEVILDKFVIMPNHFHLLLTIEKDKLLSNSSPTINSVMGWLKYQITRDINKSFNTPGNQIFQRSFHDHIIRDEHDYKLRWEYIKANIDRWLDDTYYCE